MRGIPICSASSNVSSGLRCSSLIRVFSAEHWKNASTSKAVTSRGSWRSPGNVACRLPIVPPFADTVDPARTHQGIA